MVAKEATDAGGAKLATWWGHSNMTGKVNPLPFYLKLRFNPGEHLS